MPVRSRNVVISSPGRIPNYVVGLDVPAGDTIDPNAITITASDAIADYVTAENIGVNVSTETIDGVDYAPGDAIVFDIACLAGAPAYDDDAPVYLLIDYETIAADSQRLRYKRQLEVYDYIDIE
ncbi:MAG: hypothetical protein H0T51_06670 [Pirellulales bacterium]|nr:hypothetical protein [Pirellulales bacterium]